MTYISTCTWRDLTDGHLYAEGEPFLFDGREVPEDRLERLRDGSNRAGLVLIRAEESKADETVVPKDEAPEKAPEAPKTAAKKTAAKKTTTKKTTTKK